MTSHAFLHVDAVFSMTAKHDLLQLANYIRFVLLFVKDQRSNTIFLFIQLSVKWSGHRQHTFVVFIFFSVPSRIFKKPLQLNTIAVRVMFDVTEG